MAENNWPTSENLRAWARGYAKGRGRNFWKQRYDTQHQTVHRLEARVESYEQALKRIAYHGSDVCNGDCALWMVDIARSALRDGGKS